MKAKARPYGRFSEETARRGIRKTLAYALRDAGLIETFSIGRAAFVFVDTLDDLPERLQEPAARAALEAVQHRHELPMSHRGSTRRRAA